MPSTHEPGPPLLDSLPISLPLEELLKIGGEQGILLEPYKPLGCALDWELGQLFYRRRGNSAFLNGEVPYLVNNDGVLAARAADLLFTSIDDRARSGELPGDLRALEFGGGACLFARGFLLAFERISKASNRDYHERLTYVLADHSEPMLEDARRCGVIPSGSRVVFARADAVEQQFEWVAGSVDGRLRFDAIFLNYLLDCLPATVLRRSGDALEQLYVQTELSPKNPRLSDIARAKERVTVFTTGGNADRGELIDLYPLFRLRCRYQKVAEQDVPRFDTIASQLKDAKPVLHNYAAAACLEACVRKLRPGGFVLFSDYPAAGNSEPPEDVTRLFHQHFGASTAIGLNLPQLKECILKIPGSSWVEPPNDDESLIVRLAGSATGDRTVARFREVFDRVELERLRAPRRLARQYRGAGGHQLALDCYREAIRSQPENWELIGEVAQFCEAALRQHDMALQLARTALDLNPIDPDLWNTLGDSLFSMGRKDEAHQAFRWALEMSPTSARARYNLVYTLTNNGDLEAALAMIAETFAADRKGEYTDRLLKRQSEILNALKQRARRIAEGMADRYTWDSY